MDVGRRHKTSGSETKDFIIHDPATWISYCVSSSSTKPALYPTVATWRGLCEYFTNSESASPLRNNELGEFTFYSKNTLCPRERSYLSLKDASCKHSPEKWPRQWLVIGTCNKKENRPWGLCGGLPLPVVTNDPKMYWHKTTFFLWSWIRGLKIQPGLGLCFIMSSSSAGVVQTARDGCGGSTRSMCLGPWSFSTCCLLGLEHPQWLLHIHICYQGWDGWNFCWPGILFLLMTVQSS